MNLVSCHALSINDLQILICVLQNIWVALCYLVIFCHVVVFFILHCKCWLICFQSSSSTLSYKTMRSLRASSIPFYILFFINTMPDTQLVLHKYLLCRGWCVTMHTFVYYLFRKPVLRKALSSNTRVRIRFYSVFIKGRQIYSTSLIV